MATTGRHILTLIIKEIYFLKKRKQTVLGWTYERHKIENGKLFFNGSIK